MFVGAHVTRSLIIWAQKRGWYTDMALYILLSGSQVIMHLTNFLTHPMQVI